MAPLVTPSTGIIKVPMAAIWVGNRVTTLYQAQYQNPSGPTML